MNPDEIFDKNGVPVKIGMRVLDHLGREEGTVVNLTPLDHDVDDDGLPTGTGPYVHVHYDEDVDDKLLAVWTAKGIDDMDSPYVCLDLVVKDDDGE